MKSGRSEFKDDESRFPLAVITNLINHQKLSKLIPPQTIEQNPIYTEEELREYEQVIAKHQSNVSKKAEELQKQREELQRKEEELKAQKALLQQVHFNHCQSYPESEFPPSGVESHPHLHRVCNNPQY